MRERRAAALLLCLLLLPIGALAQGSIMTGTVTASALVLREGPGTEHNMVAEIPQGARISIFTEEDGWYFVHYGEHRGYVSARYVRIDLPEETAQPVATPTPQPGTQLPALEFTGDNNPGYPMVMKPGDMGNAIVDLQMTLQNLGYAVSQDGQYGYDTQAAVMKLQQSMGIDADGIIGAQTRRLLGNKNQGGVELLDWWTAGSVAYPRLTEATVVDVRTGTRFRISRYGGNSHCDVEPLTAADTATFRGIVGEWTWDRRPVWLEFNGRIIAASMSCMPHEGQHITDNGFNGHFCLHFHNSRTHDTNRVDEAHAACVQEAWAQRERYAP